MGSRHSSQSEKGSKILLHLNLNYNLAAKIQTKTQTGPTHSHKHLSRKHIWKQKKQKQKKPWKLWQRNRFKKERNVSVTNCNQLKTDI